MKHGRLVLLALLFLPGALLAQTSTSTDGIRPRSSAGDFALLFDLGGLADLALNGFRGGVGDTSEVGAGFGAKYFVADDIAVRLGLSVLTSSASRPVGSDSLGLNDEFSVFRFGITPSVLVNVMKTGPVAGYLGGQVSFATTTSDNNPADELVADVEGSSTAFGVAGIIGAEWFPWQSVSLSAEYVLGFATSSAEETRTLPNTPEQRFELPTETTVGLRSRGVLNVAIYW
jgi:hypothetical protein